MDQCTDLANHWMSSLLEFAQSWLSEGHAVTKDTGQSRDGPRVLNALVHWSSEFLHETYNYAVGQANVHRVGGAMFDCKNLARMHGA